jgi:hypothetical protein
MLRSARVDENGSCRPARDAEAIATIGETRTINSGEWCDRRDSQSRERLAGDLRDRAARAAFLVS